MRFMQNFRKIGLATLVLVVSAVAAQAANVTLLTFGDMAPVNDVDGTQLTTSSTNIAASGISVRIGGPTISTQEAYMTFSLTTTTSASNINDNGDGTYQFRQGGYTGTFSITSGPGGSGTVLLAGNLAAGRTVSNTGDQSFSINSSTNPGSSGWTGSLASQFSSPFGWSFNFGNVTPGVGLSNTTAPATISSFHSNVTGTFTATTTVPEPSTLSLLGLGAAGLAFGAYRRRKTAAAV